MGVPPFDVFLEDHRRTVWRFLAATVGRDHADDVFQETFLAALRAYPRLRDGSNLRAWVLTIATRKAVDHARGRARRAVPVAEVPERPAPERDDGEPTVWRAVASLPPKQRAAVALRFVADLSHAEVGLAMDCSEEAARRSVHEALRKLRAQFGDRI
jgi:RNA polymerase sigma factor (sigma-70 family)